MNVPVNPFSPGKPIQDICLFINQQWVIEAILLCLKKGKSCSVIGGVGMGKTSTLKHIERVFSWKTDVVSDALFHFIPIYFKPNLRNVGSIRCIYQQLVDVTISQTRTWLKNCALNAPEMVFDELNFSSRIMQTGTTALDTDKVCEAFEGDLWEIIKAIRHAVANAKLVFLLDDIYRIEDAGIKETLARHLFDVLDEENHRYETLRAYVVIVMTGFKDHVEQYIPRRPNTLTGLIGNSIEPIYLQALERTEVREAICRLFRDTLGLELMCEVVEEICNLTGGHPLLLQSVMSDLWVEASKNTTVDIAFVGSYMLTWRERYPEIYRWIGEMISANRMLIPVFELLISEDKTWEWIDLTESLKDSPEHLRYLHQLRDALRILKSFGVVCEDRRRSYRVSGSFFREWLKPLSLVCIDETNHGFQIARLVEEIGRVICFLEQYKDVGGVNLVQKQLEKELATLETSRTELINLEKHFSSEDLPRSERFRRIINDVQRIRYYMCFSLRCYLADLGIQMGDLSLSPWVSQLPGAEPGPEAQVAPFQPRSTPKYVINFYGPADGLTVGDGVGDLSAQLSRGVEDIKRGQAALYRRMDQAYRDDLICILAAIQQGRLEQDEIQATLDILKQAMQAVVDGGLPIVNDELRTAIADLTEAVESSLSLERKLELSLPLFPPFLEYKIELAVDSVVDLHDLLDDLRKRWKRLVERVRH